MNTKPTNDYNSYKEKEGGQASNFILPDGTTVRLGAEKQNAPEILFDPKQIGLEYVGVHELV
jgi:centractin